MEKEISIVKFEDGYYAVRRGKTKSFEYLEHDGSYWWDMEYCGEYCKGTKEEAEKAIENLEELNKPTDYGTPIIRLKRSEY